MSSRNFVLRCNAFVNYVAMGMIQQPFCIPLLFYFILSSYASPFHLIYLHFSHLITFLLISFIFVLFISMSHSIFHLLQLTLRCFFSSFLFLCFLLSFHHLHFQLSYFHFLPSVITSYPAIFSTFFSSYLLSCFSSFHVFPFLLSSFNFPSAAKTWLIVANYEQCCHTSNCPGHSSFSTKYFRPGGVFLNL